MMCPGEMTLWLVNVLVAVVLVGSGAALFARSAPISLHDQCGFRGSVVPASRRAGSARPCRAELVQVERPTGRTTWTSSARCGCLRWATGRRGPAGISERPGPGRDALAAGGRVRVVG